jgi:hypothetical protein
MIETESIDYKTHHEVGQEMGEASVQSTPL